MPESCGQLKMLGVTKPKTLLVNPQKIEANNEPIEVIKKYLLTYLGT